MNDMTNPLARARGHGSAKSGVHHWIAQRFTSVVLLVLIPWLVYALSSLLGQGHAAAVQFIAQPWNATLLVLLLVVLAYHATLGLQVVIEDYIHNRALELALHFIVRASAITGTILGVIYVLKLALGS